MTAAEQLNELAEARADCLYELDVINQGIPNAVATGKDEGLSMTEIAKHLRVSRQGLYYILAQCDKNDQ